MARTEACEWLNCCGDKGMLEELQTFKCTSCGSDLLSRPYGYVEEITGLKEEQAQESCDLSFPYGEDNLMDFKLFIFSKIGSYAPTVGFSVEDIPLYLADSSMVPSNTKIMRSHIFNDGDTAMLRDNLELFYNKDDAPSLAARVKKTDAREFLSFYNQYYQHYVLPLCKDEKADRAQLGKAYQTAATLFEVLRFVDSTEKVDEVSAESCHITCAEVGESSNPVLRNKGSKVEVSKAGVKRGVGDDGSQEIKRAKVSTTTEPKMLLGGDRDGMPFPKPAFVWRGGGRASIYFPIEDKIRDVDFNGMDWIIRGYRSFDPWVAFQRNRQLNINYCGNTALLPNLPDTLLLFNLPRDLYIIESLFIQMQSEVTIAVNFLDDNFRLFWHYSDKWGTWTEKTIIQPGHSPHGLIIYRDMVLWLNTINGTLHILRHWKSKDTVVHESYSLGERFIANQVSEKWSFSPVTDGKGGRLYFFKYAEQVGKAVEVSLFLIGIDLNANREVNVPISVTKVETLDGLTMFASKDKAGFIMQLENKKLRNKVYFSGYENEHCVLLSTWSPEDRADPVILSSRCDYLVRKVCILGGDDDGSVYVYGEDEHEADADVEDDDDADADVEDDVDDADDDVADAEDDAQDEEEDDDDAESVGENEDVAEAEAESEYERRLIYVCECDKLCFMHDADPRLSMFLGL